MCSSSTSQSDIAYVPGISLSLDETVVVSSSNMPELYVYEVPEDSLDCSGSVIGVEYCYESDTNSGSTDENIFTVLIFNKVSADPPLFASFVVVNSVPVPNPTEVCSRCCGMYNFMEHFELPEGGFALGILTSNSQHQLYLYHNSVTQYRTGGYVIPSTNVLTTPNSTVNAGTQNQLITLRTMRLIISEFSY